MYIYIYILCAEIEQLKVKGSRNPFGGVQLTFYKLGPTNIVSVSNRHETMSKDYLTLHFERHTGPSTVKDIDLKGEKALVVFHNTESKS